MYGEVGRRATDVSLQRPSFHLPLRASQKCRARGSDRTQHSSRGLRGVALCAKHRRAVARLRDFSSDMCPPHRTFSLIVFGMHTLFSENAVLGGQKTQHSSRGCRGVALSSRFAPNEGALSLDWAVSASAFALRIAPISTHLLGGAHKLVHVVGSETQHSSKVCRGVVLSPRTARTASYIGTLLVDCAFSAGACALRIGHFTLRSFAGTRNHVLGQQEGTRWLHPSWRRVSSEHRHHELFIW